MKTTESKKETRDAYLPMNLLNDGDLDIINNSDLDEHDRDTAVYYFIASRMMDMTQITVDVFTQGGKYPDQLEPKTDLANFLAKNGKNGRSHARGKNTYNVAQNLLEHFEWVDDGLTHQEVLEIKK